MRILLSTIHTYEVTLVHRHPWYYNITQEHTLRPSEKYGTTTENYPSISWKKEQDFQLVNPKPPSTQYSVRHTELTPGELIGGGPLPAQQPISTSKYPYSYPAQVLKDTGPLCIARYSRVGPLPWKPRSFLALHHSNHIIDRALTDTLLERIKYSCQQPDHHILVYSKKNNRIHLTSTQLRNLMENGKSINDKVLHLFFGNFCTIENLPFLSPHFFPLLERNGWEQARRSFSPHSHHPLRSIYKPGIRGESGIAIPCFINGCHWVGLVRREIQGKVLFLFSDDLNNKSTELMVKNKMKQACKTFFPDNAKWINCRSITYQPHYNECGPRTALAIMVMMLHPDPHENILMGCMDPNLSQILRTWICGALLSGDIFIPPMFRSKLSSPTNLLGRSSPASLVDWSDTSKKDTALSSTEESIKDIPLVSQTNPLKGTVKYKEDGITHDTSNNSPKPKQAKTQQLSSSIETDKLIRLSGNDNGLNQVPSKHDPQEPVPTKCVLPTHIHPTTIRNPYLKTSKKAALQGKREQAKSPLHRFIKKLDFSHKQNITTTQSSTTLASLHGLPSISILEENVQSTSSSHKKNHVPRRKKTTLDYHGFSSIPKYIQCDEISGHSPEVIDTSSIFRILLQNPRGLKFSEGDDIARFSWKHEI
jgi:hypothetical protein